MSLSELIDLIGYSRWIFKKSKNGTKPSKGAWGLTKLFLKDYGDIKDYDLLVNEFTNVGITDEMSAIRFIFTNEDLIP